ncbi:MAG: CDP-glycerol glycerophosphotransferase family protein [Cryobacterium sp.]|uniref:glycosyltransferase n=1 Tax=unclassified Cryobacterium TaxID=2649013 RepID=UPI0018CB481E|nr:MULTISPECIES: glycosyltransferase [unclassified Cryobacterium]MCY7404720.1 CDP-glycerol glycerophosphotransferase family protein [Cryobacterium sp.]
MNLTRVMRLASRAKRFAQSQLHAHWRGEPIRQGTVLYESFSGNGVLCNPEAIFRQLLATPDMGQLNHIWVLSDLKQYGRTVAEFSGAPNVTFVRHGSPSYHRALATSEFLVNNSTFPPQFSKRPGQTYLNTWHGTPLKRMGYDIDGGARGTANIVRNFVAADYLLAANPFMAEQMYEKGYKLSGIFTGLIIEEGYPRIDRQALDGAGVFAGRARLTDAGIPLGDRTIVLYAPTWKGASFARPNDDIDQLLDHVARITARIDTSKYVVLLKTHQIVHARAASRPDLTRLLVPNDMPTNVVLGLAGVLITDYSSIFFDFLCTGRPIVFFAPDLDEYEGTRGLYFAPENWPGPVCRTMEELTIELARTLLTGGLPAESAARYRAAQLEFCGRNDGGASARIVDIVFRGNVGAHHVRSVASSAHRSILVYLGGMQPNGITTSALNLLNNIDHTRFDVSAFFAQSAVPAAIANQNAIHPAVRQFARVGGMNGSARDQLARRLHYYFGRISQHQGQATQKRLWDDEWARCFGDSRFDYVIDFSGYGPFWSALLLHSPEAIRSIWLHNDLASDAHRTVRGRKRMLRSLTQNFTLYEQYDHLVSVSQSLSQINSRKLAHYAEPAKFTFAPNTANATHVLVAGAQDLRETARDTLTGITPAWVDDILADDDITTFVSVGRLSPEKNQARLIRAFGLVHAQTPATRLVLVGEGVLRGALEALIKKLGLEGAVTLTGVQQNPYAILAASDCFVLSSDYEGQPMVILEALVLGLPIVTVDFESVQNALPIGFGLVVPQTDAGLAAGLRTFLSGQVRSGAFDHGAYTRLAVDQFYRAIGAET